MSHADEWIKCDECGAEGPSEDTEDEATEAWNTRAAAPVPPAGGEGEEVNWKAEWEAVCGERIKDREASQAIINERDAWIVDLIRERDALAARAQADVGGEGPRSSVPPLDRQPDPLLDLSDYLWNRAQEAEGIEARSQYEYWYEAVEAARAQPPVGEVVKPRAYYIESNATPGECWELIEGREPTEYEGDDAFTIIPLYAHPAEPAARDGGEAVRVFTVSPSGGGWPVTIVPSKVESFNAKGCNSDERRVVMVSGESYRLRLSDADAILAALAASGEK